MPAGREAMSVEREMVPAEWETMPAGREMVPAERENGVRSVIRRARTSEIKEK